MALVLQQLRLFSSALKFPYFAYDSLSHYCWAVKGEYLSSHFTWGLQSHNLKNKNRRKLQNIGKWKKNNFVDYGALGNIKHTFLVGELVCILPFTILTVCNKKHIFNVCPTLLSQTEWNYMFWLKNLLVNLITLLNEH